jgi:hypothetical protein
MIEFNLSTIQEIMMNNEVINCYFWPNRALYYASLLQYLI